MNRLRDYTRLVRMHGGALEAAEMALTLPELENYKDGIIRLLPSFDIGTKGRGAGLTDPQINKVAPFLNSNPVFSSADGAEFTTEYGLIIAASIPKVSTILTAWLNPPYSLDVTSLNSMQNWALLKLVEVLERIDNLSKATTTRKVPPTAVARVGPPRASIPAFEDDLLKWLKDDASVPNIPDDAAFKRNDDWAKVDVQTLEAHDALKNKGKVTLLINKLAPLYTANPAINEAFGMQLGLLSTYEQ